MTWTIAVVCNTELNTKNKRGSILLAQSGGFELNSESEKLNPEEKEGMEGGRRQEVATPLRILQKSSSFSERKMSGKNAG